MAKMFVKKRNTFMEIVGQVIIALSAMTAVLYGIKLYPANMALVFKFLPVALLGLFVLVNIRKLDHGILFVGLVFSAFADLVIALPGPGAFKNGLIVFLIVQVIYILLFLKNRLRAEEVSQMRLKLASLLWAISILAVFFMYPKLDEMLQEVIFYTFSVTAMVTAALISRFPLPLVGVGAALFLVSDALIGTREFLDAPAYVDYVIWAFYYIGQLMITLGVMLGPVTSSHRPYRFEY